MRISDWSSDVCSSDLFEPDATVEFSDALAPGSCRPWVGPEAAEINLAPNAKRRYWFEVRVPTAAPDGDCRLATMVQRDHQYLPGRAAVQVSGRIGPIVHPAIVESAAQLGVGTHD